MAVSSENNNQSESCEILDALGGEEERILSLCALVSEPTSVMVLQNCLRRADLGASWPKETELPAVLTRLQRRGLIDESCVCQPSLLEIIARQAADKEYFTPLCQAVQQELPAGEGGGEKTAAKHYARITRELRLAINSHDTDRFNTFLLAYLNLEKGWGVMPPVVQICNSPFDIDWFGQLPPQIQLYALHEILKWSFQSLCSLDAPLAFLKLDTAIATIPPEGRPSFYYLLIVCLMLKGELAEAKAVIDAAGTDVASFGLQGWFNFLIGKNDGAIRSYEDDLASLQRINGRKEVYFTGFEGIFYILALLKTGDFRRYEQVRQTINTIQKIQPQSLFLPVYSLLKTVVNLQEHPESQLNGLIHLISSGSREGFTSFFYLLVCYWFESRLDNEKSRLLQTLYEKACARGHVWLAMETGNLAQNAGVKYDTARLTMMLQGKGPDIVSIVPIIKQEEPWKRALKALNAATGDDSRYPDAEVRYRLTWFIEFDEATNSIGLIPKEQKLRANGQWTKGKVVALKRLFNMEEVKSLTEQDRRICQTIKTEQAYWGASYEFDLEKAFSAMIGHPFIFLADDPTTPIELVKGNPEIRVEKKDDMLFLSLNPPELAGKIKIIKETPTRVKVITITRNHRRIARILGPNGLKVPEDAKDKVMSVLENISSHVVVHSAVSGISSVIEEVEAQTKIFVHLLPIGEGFRLSFYVKPFGTGGPYLKPGRGEQNVIAEIGDIKLQTKRNLVLEEQIAASVEESCPTLLLHEVEEWEWVLAEPEDCLQVLLELSELGDRIAVEWPEGKKITVSPQVSFDNMSLRIRKKNNWFELSGELSLDESLMLDMRKLLEMSQKTRGRFVPLGRGHFLTLSQEFRRKLDELSSYSELKKSKVRLHPLAALAVEEFGLEGMDIDADHDWQQQIERIKNARKLQPKVPVTLQAELRDYQVEGYQWLARMAHWGVGACLADDMGLGKTIQALAIILTRAKKGPTLVVAPTSVCLNWQEEAKRFAPTLKVRIFGGRNRKKLLRDLKSFDMLISSYGMLQQEAELLAEKEWQTIVLDEAQAIKNVATKRSRAAMSLKGEFKLITTGTPIENHLGELWNLFNFINPGLLGSLNQFRERFAGPIERHEDKNARKRLKKLIQPFILRRIKSAVLDELPARTEILLQVDLSKPETAFYEALRREALERLKNVKGPPGQRHLQILAEITKLRLACCNARLVAPEADIPSAKLELFGNIVDELIGSRHRALVFSQFVSHLDLIRQELEARNVSYLYIDGKTPAKKRNENVTRFQAGEGDLFLISLKAGGLGLNLTAADYVILMDPWWNPAVEDQASDRAHRIGQLHPVTIYRLITRNTIEEKIVKLHEDKRDLANSLLDGSDLSHKISADELLQLLKDNI